MWASPEEGLVEVHGTVDAWTLRRRVERVLNMRVEIAEIASDSSPPHVYRPGAMTTTHYGPPQPPAYGWGVAPPPHAYYSQPPQPPHAYYSQPPPPPHAYYSQPPPAPRAYYSQPPPPPGSYSHPYPAGGYGAGWADPDPYV